MNHKTTNVRTLTVIALMGAISSILMLLEFSVPIAPAFLKFDISDLPALFVAFFFGPVSGGLVVLVKVLLKLIFEGTNTAMVGELMNIVGSFCYILPAGLIYRRMHTKKGAIISLITATVVASIAYIFIDAYIAFPLYSNLYGLPMETIIGMGTAINPRITDSTTLMLYSVFPFNLIKYTATSAITYLLYKRVGHVLIGMIAPSRSDA